MPFFAWRRRAVGRCTRKGYAASVRRQSRQRLRYGHRPLRGKGKFFAFHLMILQSRYCQRRGVGDAAPYNSVTFDLRL